MKKLSTGVYGLNDLVGGGINANSTTVVIGASGAGKTTLATQFLRRGIEKKEDGIFITLDEAPDQLLKEAVAMGWEGAQKCLDEGSFVFVDAGGKQFTNFIKHELAEFVKAWEGHNARIVIDPLTPVLWSSVTKYEQREIVSFLLRETRKIGTVLCTLEEHGGASDLSSPEITIPMYLADNVVHLRYSSMDNPESRDLNVVKSRMSPHSPFSHPYSITQGVGVVVHGVERVDEKEVKRGDVQQLFKKMMDGSAKDKFSNLTSAERKNITRTVQAMSKSPGLDAEEVLALVMKEYGLF